MQKQKGKSKIFANLSGSMKCYQNQKKKKRNLVDYSRWAGTQQFRNQNGDSTLVARKSGGKVKSKRSWNEAVDEAECDRQTSAEPGRKAGSENFKLERAHENVNACSNLDSKEIEYFNIP